MLPSSLRDKSPQQWYALPSSPLVLVYPRPPLRVRPCAREAGEVVSECVSECLRA
eukprot:COSAG01_NODE_181_length_22873_cov_12.951392_14_plen_55_part_00